MHISVVKSYVLPNSPSTYMKNTWTRQPENKATGCGFSIPVITLLSDLEPSAKWPWTWPVTLTCKAILHFFSRLRNYHAESRSAVAFKVNNNNNNNNNCGGTGTRNWKTDDQQDRWRQGVHLPVPAAVRGTTEGECGLIPKHVHNQLARCNLLFFCLTTMS